MTQPHHKKNYVIAGGLAGLFAARILKTFGADKITIVEKADRTGGLLQSVLAKNPLGNGKDFSFDHGTHFVLMPKTPEIQTIILRDLDIQNYHRFDDSLQEGHFFNGELYEASGCVSFLSLPQNVRDAVFDEMKSLAPQSGKDKEPETLEDACFYQYGPTATEILKKIYKKLTGLLPADLATSMQGKLFPARIILAGRQESIELKKNLHWDERLAYADCRDSQSDILKLYPKVGGIGQWLDTLAKNLANEGIEIITSVTIDSLETDSDNRIIAANLSNSQKIKCDILVWTLPAIFLSLMTKTPVPSSKPQIRSVSLCHFLTNKRPVSRPHWITNLDENYLSYRVTLYDNITSSEEGPYRLTVEILSDAPLEDNALKDKIFEELKKTKILPADAECLWSAAAHKREGFPLIKPGVAEIYNQQMDILENTFPNVCFAGRRSEAGHGQIPIMQNAYDVLTKVFAA